MSDSVRSTIASSLHRWIGKVGVLGAVVTLPACHIPAYRSAEAGPELPASYTSLSSTPKVATLPTAPTVSIPSVGVSSSGKSPAANTSEKPVNPETSDSISGAILIPTGGTIVSTLPKSQVIAAQATSSETKSTPSAITDSNENSAQIRVEDYYTDPLLIDLIQKAVSGNRELKQLEQEVQIASNEVLSRRGAYLPSVRIGGGGGFEKTSRFTRNGAVEEQLLLPPGRTFPDPLPNTRLGLDIDWQLDIWRQFRNSRDAAIQQFQAAIERRNFFVTRLVADVAENYYELMALDKRMENLNQTIKLQEQSLELAKAKKDAARGTELAVQRFLAEVRKNQSERWVVQQEILETENRINVLLNRYPEPIQRASATFFDLNLQALNVGFPAQLLRNRPDIRKAEREIAAAGLDVKVARARFYPSMSITAGVGYEAFNPRYLFRPEALAAGVAGNLVAPLINKKAIQADYLTANARQLQTIYEYQRTVVNAFTEVVNRVSMAENYRQSVELKQQQLKALEASVESATNLFQNGRAEYIEVLFAQRDLMDGRMDLINTKRQQLSAIVNAFQALGGGGTLAPAPVLVSAPSLGDHWKSR